LATTNCRAASEHRDLAVIEKMLSEDLNERNKAEQAVRDAKDLQRSPIVSRTDCIKMLDLEGRLLWMNEGGMQALEICDLGPFVNRSWIQLWEGEDAKAAQAAVEVARSGGTSRFTGYFVTTTTKQPKWWDVVVSPIWSTEGKPERLLVVSRDVTDHKRNEKALREAHLQVTRSEQRWRSVFENSAIGVALTGLDGYFLAANPVYEKMVGYSEEELRALSFMDITNADYREANWALATELREGKRQQYQIEKQYRCKDGSMIWVRNNISLVPGTESRGEFIMTLSEDITERKNAEEALRKSEHLKRNLLDINNAIITNLTEEALLRSISEALRPSILFDRCAVTLYTPETDTFRFLAVEGALRSDYFQPGLEMGRAETSAGWVFEHRRPLLRNLDEEQQFPNESRLWAEGLRSLCVVPLILRGKCIGTLSVVSREKLRYSEENAQFLQEVAIQVALAIENMKFYEEIATLKARLEKENTYLREEIRTEHNFEEIVGNSPALLAVLRAVEQVAPTDSTVLINGETGTGKELIARAIHNRSARKDRALVSVNCSAISAGLVESELFGHLKGAFTGAIERRIGRFELANGGTIFLDEIGELPLEMQVKLLRVLQEHEFEPVGTSRTQRVDVRVIAATNRNLREMVEAGRFRSDLFYRLNVLPLQLPPLRERSSDIPQLVALCVPRFAKRFGKKVEGVSKETMARLISYPWPGNIRELQNVLERAVVLSAGPILRLDKDLVPVTASEGTLEAAELLVQEAQPAVPANAGMPTLEEVQRSHILAALQQANGVVDGPKGAARILNLHPNTLRHRMSKLGIKRSAHRQS
jgi:formate hydrogenlyase transcriptional activator